MPPLLADFTHARACNPICEKSLTLPKFIWHMIAFVVACALILVVLCRIFPEPERTTTIEQIPHTSSTQSTNKESTDFDSVKERVDTANKSIGKEVKSLYSGEGKSAMQRQLETRLFFNTLKSVLICVLLIVVIVVLLKKGFSLKKFKKIFEEDEHEEDEPVAVPFPTDEEKTTKEIPDKTAEDEDKEPIPTDDDEPPFEENVEPDEAVVAENCKL